MNQVIAILRRMEPADYVLDLLAFAGTVTLALVFRWRARDLIWSLWISSLSSGYALMFTAYFFPWRVFNRHRKALAAEAALAQPDS